MPTRRKTGKEIRVPGGLRTVRGEDVPKEVTAEGRGACGELVGVNLNSPRPLRCSVARLTPGARGVRPGARCPGCPVD